jgi:hypothetical protein
MLAAGPRSGLKYSRARAAGAPGFMKRRFGLSRRSHRAAIRSVQLLAAMVRRGQPFHKLRRIRRNQIERGSVEGQLKEALMTTCQTGRLALAVWIAFALSTASGLAAGAGGGPGGGTGAAGRGSAAVGGGAPAGAVGGGPTAGRVGGGAPGSNDAAGNGAAGTGNPALNSGVVQVSPESPAAGLESAPTAGGVIGGTTGVPPQLGTGGMPPPVMGQSQPAGAPQSVKGVAEEAPPSTVGLAKPGPDGVSTIIVKPQPCGVAAHETDGVTTCIGIPSRQ